MDFFRRWAWLFALLIFSFSALYASGIDSGSSHDKLKYLSIAWTMYHSGHYLIPIVNGIPYTDKPPLLFWLMVSMWHLFGVNMFSLQCLIDMILVSWGLMLRSAYAIVFPNDQVGKDFVPYVLLGTYAIWSDMWFLRVDILLLTGVLLCNLGIIKLLAFRTMHSKDIKTFAALFYVSLGCCIGLFAKGPIFYVFTFLPFLYSSIFTKSYRQFFPKIIIAMSLGTFIFLVSWVIPAIVSTNHTFAKEILYQQVMHRALYSEKSYFIYLYRYLPMLFIPWIINILFIKKLHTILQQTLQYRSFLSAIFTISIIIFSCFGQKSLWYLLPLLPFGVILFARFFVEYKDNVAVIRVNLMMLNITFALLGTLCLGLIFSSRIQRMMFVNFGGNFLLSPIIMLSLAAINFTIVGYFYFYKKNLTGLISIGSVVLLLIYGVFNTYFFPFEKKFTQINQVGVYLQQQEGNKKGIALYQSEYLGQFTYSGHLMEVIPTLWTQFDLEQWLQKYPQGIVLYNGKNCPAIAHLHKISFYQERASLVPFLLCQK